MNQLSIEICKTRAEANVRKDIIKSGNPNASWETRIIEDIAFVTPSLVTDIGVDPDSLPPIFTPNTGAPVSPAVVLLIWTKD